MKHLICVILFSIVTTSVMGQDTPLEKPFSGRNIVVVIPMQLMNNSNDNYYGDNNGTDVAVGMAFERILNNEYIGLKIPISFSLQNPGFYYFMPAIKLYPKKQGVVKYAVGPQFLIATGKIKYRYYQNNYPYNTSYLITENSTQLGFMINNSLNVTVAKQFYLGMELGIGVKYFDSRDNRDDNNSNQDTYNSTFDPNIQFNFNMGYRF